MADYCDDCDFPTDMCQCGAAAAAAKREAEILKAERTRALSLPGVVAAKFPGTCPACRSRYADGDPIHHTPDGWVGTLCCPDTRGEQ